MDEFVPEGYLTHVEAFQKFLREYRAPDFLELCNPHDHRKSDQLNSAIEWSNAWNEKWEVYAKEFVAHLVAGELEFLITNPNGGGRARILPAEWESDWWPQRPLMSETIQTAGDTRLRKYTGRIPFVEQHSFRQWLSKLQGREAVLDDMPQTPDRPKFSHRPPVQFMAATAYLGRSDAMLPSENLHALVAHMKEKTGVSVSRDTMRRARLALSTKR